MKRFIMVLLSVLLVVCLFTGCDGNAVSELVDDGKIYTNAKTCIIGENYITSRFGKELCSRFKNRTGSLNDASRSLLNNTEVVIVDGKYLDEVDFDKNLIWHALKGKTLIINEPTVATYTGVEVMLSAFMTPSYGIMTEDEQALYADELGDLKIAFLNTLKDVEVDTSQLPPEFDIESLRVEAREAVAIRGKHVYSVGRVEPATLTGTDDFSQNYVEAANFLVKWSKGEYDPNKADSRSAANMIFSQSETDAANRGTSSDLADLIDAQTFSYSFTAQKPKDYDGSNETVNVNMTAWTACNIDKQLDYYAVKTQVILNNQQLNYRNEWNKTDDDGNWAYCGPFLEKVEVVGSPCDLSGTSKYVDHSPLNKTDSSTSVTTGSTSYTVGLNDCDLVKIVAKGDGISYDDSPAATFTFAKFRSVKNGSSSVRFTFRT